MFFFATGGACARPRQSHQASAGRPCRRIVTGELRTWRWKATSTPPGAPGTSLEEYCISPRFDVIKRLGDNDRPSPANAYEGLRAPQDRPMTAAHKRSPSLFRKRECFPEDHPMIPKRVTALLILFAFATAVANSASAESGSFRDHRIFQGRGDGSVHRRGHHWRSPSVITGGFVGIDGYGNEGDYGSGGATGSGYGDWYGISSGHDDCPAFRKRVLTPEGWQIQVVPIC
jgi:hypothetical protein